jgi:hypothetical protein
MKDVVSDAEVGGSPAASRNETPNRTAAQDHRCEQAERGHQVRRQRGNDGSQWYQQLADANPANIVVGRKDFQAGGARPGSKRPYVHAPRLHHKLDIIELGRFQQRVGLPDGANAGRLGGHQRSAARGKRWEETSAFE